MWLQKIGLVYQLALLSVISITAVNLFAVRTISAATITQQKPGVPVSLKIPDTDLLVKGCVAKNSLVTIFDNGTTVGAIESDQNGQYSKLLTSQTPTIHHIQTYFEDSSGSRTAKTSNSVALPPKTLTTVTVNPAPTVTVTPSIVTAGSSFTFGGYTCPNASVNITIDGTTVLTAVADVTGQWQITVNSINYAVGTHVYSVSSSKSGYASVVSQLKQFQVVASQSSADVVVSPQEITPPTSQTPGDGEIITGDSVTVSGESVPNAQINIYENGVLYGSVFANSAGKWSFEYTATYSPVTLSFEACLNGRCSVQSKTITLYFEGLSNICKTDFRLLNYRFQGTNVNDETRLDVSYSTGGGILYIDWGDGVEEKFNHDDQQPTTIINKYLREGQYNGKTRFVQDDCEKIRYFSVNILGDEKANRVNIKLVMFLFVVLLPFSYISYIEGKKYEPKVEK